MQHWTKLTALVFMTAAVAAGCGASSRFTKPSPGYSVDGAPADAAQIVFLRPGGYAKGIGLTILDQSGNYVGDSLAKAHFAVTVPAGEHTFIAWGEGTHALRADVEAGKTYYVRVSPRMGAWSARFHLLAVKPGTEDWDKLQDWLAKTKAHAVDRERGQTQLVEKRRAKADDAVAKGVERFSAYTDQEAGERSLAPADGV